ncbi:TIM-barrel domain-containing protein [Moritella sp. Urea-trap-13]|uniref:TIM-barrel domain-containing protein n=1 Tax=Moritella sp. Urea-trap-13 TaxID=2058327 RepID=UPI000C345A0D|nr:TIM-barrel domain-containing protein [Moritella sp. Urea-trap-13]PKH09342.1 glycoside hydrolase family 31 [Moritella sp. Urea-trap-13]
MNKMSMQRLILGIAVPSLLAVSCSAYAEVERFRYQSEISYRLDAVDVFRMRNAIPDVDVRKTLKPLIGITFYSQNAFISALKKELDDEIVNQYQLMLLEKSQQQGQDLAIDVLSDDIIHIAYKAQPKDTALPTTELINTAKLNGTVKLNKVSDGFTTKNLQVTVNAQNLCVSVTSFKQGKLTDVCPDKEHSFTLLSQGDYQLNGLGQEFHSPGKLNSNWLGFKRQGGNKMEGYEGGATGNTQFPILYATNPKQQNYALYLDTIYAANWDFMETPWKVSVSQGKPSFLLMAGEGLPELRQQYMKLVGNPLVPPRKMFGMWLSEYGFDNWQEMDDKLKTLKQQAFPIDGVVMDLQWFGNVESYSSTSQMGTLTWDVKNFPEPEKKIQSLKDQGIGMMLIEESYVSEGLDEHQALDDKGYLIKDPKTGKAIDTDPNDLGHWWGKGGMIDWTNVAGGDYWHDWKRVPLIEMGVIGHWTDLGEPEMYNAEGVFLGNKPHSDVHNIFNYKWLESIYQGYQRNKTEVRPFMMSRSGAPGIQRFGATMWSADIGTNLQSLSSQFSMQPNMVLSGIDYYSSDVGGFHRGALKARSSEREAALNETYTQWFAYSSLFEVPVRPHTENLCNCKETAPDRVGDLASNKASIELRYQLIPYLYSLAHRANNSAEPVFPSMDYYYGNDPQAVNLPGQKMMGKDLLGAGIAKMGQKVMDLYLPAGKWYDYRTGEMTVSKGEWRKQLPVYHNSVIRLPLFARDGAIIPVNSQQKMPLTSDVPLTLAAKVYGTQGTFILYEDDGASNAYLKGELRQTSLTTREIEEGLLLTVEAKGDYQNAPAARPLSIAWYGIEGKVKAIELNGSVISDWTQQDGVVSVSTTDLPVNNKTELKLVID